MLAGMGVWGPVVEGVWGPVVGGVWGPVVGGVLGPVVGGVWGPVVGGVWGPVVVGVLGPVVGGVSGQGTAPVAWGTMAKGVMVHMAREVASRQLEKDTRCSLWKMPHGILVLLCWQAAAVAFGVEEGEVEAGVAGQGTGGVSGHGTGGVSGHGSGGVLWGVMPRVADRLVRAGSGEVTPRTDTEAAGAAEAGGRWRRWLAKWPAWY